MNDGELLQRMAATVKQQIAPEVADEFARTQAHMCAVVLDKLGKQLALAPAHRSAGNADMDELLTAFRQRASDAVDTPAVEAAITGLAERRDKAALCTLIDALYQAREALGNDEFNTSLGLVRGVLRAAVDRELEYAK